MRLTMMMVLLAWSVLASAAKHAAPPAPAPAPTPAPAARATVERTCPTTLPQAELNRCYDAAADDTVRRLDELLHELRGSLERQNWAYLKQSQALWEKSRNLDCRIEASFIDEPIRAAVNAGCTEKRTRERMHALRYLLCPEYDLNGRCDAARHYE